MTISELNEKTRVRTKKYKVTDETGKHIMAETDDLRYAIKLAKLLYISGLKECGIIEYIKVINTQIGTIAFVTR